MKVFWTPGARRRLQEIEAHIAQDSPQAARLMLERLLRRAQTLSEPPQLLGKRVEGYPDDDVRELMERPYRRINRVRPGAIEVLILLHYRQLPPSDLAGAYGRRGL